MKHLLFTLGLCTCFALVACKGDEASEPKASEDSEHAEWVPTDPELVKGKEIYSVECALCHHEGEEGAPIVGLAKHWDFRVAKGLPTLLDHAINGFRGDEGKMPARGGTETLTDEEVTAAVKYMIAHPR